MKGKKPDLKIVSVCWDGKTAFNYKDGSVTVTAPPGKKLTIERTAWLLRKAELEIFLDK